MLNLVCVFAAGFVHLEFVSWCDKVAIDNLRACAPSRKVSAITNDRKVMMASRLLVGRQITPGHFLNVVSYVTHSSTRYGLQLEDEDDSDTSDTDED